MMARFPTMYFLIWSTRGVNFDASNHFAVENGVDFRTAERFKSPRTSTPTAILSGSNMPLLATVAEVGDTKILQTRGSQGV
jgi:hypothetical protein